MIRFFGFSTHSGRPLEPAAKLGWVDAILVTYNFRLTKDEGMRRALDACAKAQVAITAMKVQGLNVETEDDKTIYAMGVNLARNMDHLPLSRSEQEILQAGFADGVYKREPKVDTVRYGRRAEGLFARRKAGRSELEREAAEAFLAEAAAMEGAVRSDSGLVMTVLSPGDGPSPGPADRVRVHYHGTLRDGTVFDSSYARGKPEAFAVAEVIPGWSEGLQLMKEGAKWKFFLPAKLAYGKDGLEEAVGPNAAIIIEVELVSIR